MIERVLNFAKGRDIPEPQLLELATKEVKKWSARNIAEYVGDEERVHVMYLDIRTRNVQELGMNDSIETTYAQISGQKPFNYLYSAAAPANVYNPPPQCPPRSDGATRTRSQNHERLQWLFTP